MKEDINLKIHNLLLEVGKKAYAEGRKHQVEEEEIVGVLHMKSFEDTKIYAEIMKEKP
jgi:hypothetical protein